MIYIQPTNIAELKELDENTEVFFVGFENQDLEGTPWDNLPETIKMLGFANCPSLTVVPPLHDTLEVLYLRECLNLTSSLEALPGNLKRLFFSSSAQATLTATLPEGLESLHFFAHPLNPYVPSEYPESLQELTFRGIDALPGLPKNLQKLSVENSNLESNSDLPDTIEILSISECDNLHSLPYFPKNLKQLSLDGCSNLKSLGTLPADLEILDLSGCKKLESLAALPVCLKKLDLSGCKKLEPTEELLNMLKQAEYNGCNVWYPRHFNRDALVAAAFKKLDDSIEAYKEEHSGQSQSGNVKDIFHRYLNEKIEGRGGSADVVAMVTPVLDVLAKNPNHLEWMNDVAGGFLDGCVNQPVNGMLHICGWSAVANAGSVTEKCDAAKQILAMEAIVNYMRDYPEKPGMGVEIEAGNALVREAHTRLVAEDGMKPWPGIPKGIAYEASIRTWLTPELIEGACDAIRQQVIAKSPEEVANILCETHHADTWNQVAFSEQTKALKDDFSQKMENTDREDGDKLSLLITQREAAMKKQTRDLTVTALAADKKQHEEQRHGSSRGYNPHKPVMFTDRLREFASQDRGR